jgi:translation initiation factor 4G
MFSKPQRLDAIAEPSTSKAVGGASEPRPQRRKLNLLPRTKPPVSEVDSDDEALGATMSEPDAKAKVEQDVRAFFSIRMLDKAESYFSGLPTEHRHLLVDMLVMKSIEMDESDVTLVCDLFVRVREKGLCSPWMFEEGFCGLAEILDDLAIDIPKAWSYFAVLLKCSGLDQDEERRMRLGEKTTNPDKLNELL